jgi:hypothetical protein
MKRILFLLFAVFSLTAFEASALPKTQAKQVTVDPSGLSHSSNTTVQLVLEDLDDNIPVLATTEMVGTVRFATPTEVNAGTSTVVVLSPADLKSADQTKAWANYNGVTATLRASFNIALAVRNGAGDYTFTFTTPMPDANYVITFGQSYTIAGANSVSPWIISQSTTGFNVAVKSWINQTYQADASTLCFCIFR